MSPVRPARGPSDILLVEDIRFYGHHGVTPAQQEVGAWFSVDVELALDLTPAALSDDVDATVDYGQVVRRVVAVGTSTVRALEGQAALHGGRLAAGGGVTSLVIGAAHRLRIVDGLLTGVHEPASSHFELLKAFAPEGLLREALAHAEAEGYLGHEFGDSALVLRGPDATAS